MNFDPKPFPVQEGLTNWAIAFGVCSVFAVLAVFVASLASRGRSGPGLVFKALFTGPLATVAGILGAVVGAVLGGWAGWNFGAVVLSPFLYAAVYLGIMDVETLQDVGSSATSLGAIRWTSAVLSCLACLVSGAVLGAAVADVLRARPGHVWALAQLTFREAVRRKALYVFVVFAVLFMFAGWFLPGGGSRSSIQVGNYVSFVLTSITWLTLVVVLLLSCMGIPEDIRARSLHTVVTKPVGRNEVVLGRILGYSGIGGLVLLVMGVVGYVWIVRQVPEVVNSGTYAAKGENVKGVRAYDGSVTVTVLSPGGGREEFAADSEAELRRESPEVHEKFEKALRAGVDQALACRVPVYGQLSFTDKLGNGIESKNVGDVWDFRGYIEGATNAYATYDLEDVTAEKFGDRLTLQSSFEAFRTHKGVMKQGVLVQYTLVNPNTNDRVDLPAFNIKEFGTNLTHVERELSQFDKTTGERSTLDLYDDMAPDGKLRIQVACLSPGQFLGMARPDLFIRQPDRAFAVGYSKALAGVALMMLLVIVFGVTAGCFVKWPVATLLVAFLMIVGVGFHDFLGKLVGGELEGSGTIESMYRIGAHMNPTTQLMDSRGTRLMVTADRSINGGLWMLYHVAPDFNQYSLAPYVANGFDVPFKAALLPCLLTTLAYILPCLLLGYFSLRLRELEAK